MRKLIHQLMRRMLQLAIAAAMGALLASVPSVAISAEPGKRIKIRDPWVRVFPADGTITAYFTVDNPSVEPDRLLSVSTPFSGRVGIFLGKYETLSPADIPVPSVDIGSYKRIRFRPGGYFVKFESPVRSLRVGEIVPLTLQFQRSGRIEVRARVTNQLLGNRRN